MAMSDADIRRELRELLSRSTKVHGKTENYWGLMGLAAGVAVGVFVTAIINQFVELVTWADWIVFLILAFATFRAMYGAGETINNRRAEKLAERFYGIFPKDSEAFNKAIVWLKKAKTESGVEKALLAALKMDVTFTTGGKKSGFLETGEFGFQVGGKKNISPAHAQLVQMMSEFSGGNFSKSESGPGWSSHLRPHPDIDGDLSVLAPLVVP